MRTISIANRFEVGPGAPLLLIAGPCQIESLEHCLKMADLIQASIASKKINLVFKSSFDKANRTSLQGQRGPGIDAGLEILRRVKEKTGLPILTDIHTAEQAQLAAEVVDVLQIPAFLCRQTDLLLAAGKTGRAINVKKGQFLHPLDMQYAADKVTSTGNRNVLLCERGTSFGYRDLVVDMRSLPLMQSCGYPVVFDATHSVMQMGARDGKSGGSREFIQPLALAASAVGIHGLFIECHDNPDQAPSDGANMLPVEALAPLLDRVLKVRDAVA